MMISQVDFSDMRKTRRSVLIASIAVLLLSSVELENDILQVLGLEFVVSLERIAEAIRVFLAFFLGVFLLRAVEVFPKQLHRYLLINHKAWQKRAEADLHEIENQIHNPDYDPNQDPFEQHDGFYYFGKLTRENRRKRVFILGRLIQGLTTFIIEFLAVLCIGILALAAPNALNDHLDRQKEISSENEGPPISETSE